MDLKFNEIMNELNEIHSKFPDLRFGQIIQCAIDTSNQITNTNLNDKSSKVILKALQEFKINHSKRRRL